MDNNMLYTKNIYVQRYYLKYFIVVSFMLLFHISDVFAKPIVSIPSDLSITTATEIDIPVYLSNISGSSIGGYILRLNYSDQLSNPVIITDGTLSQGKTVKSGPPTDGLGGKLAIGLMSGFSPQEDGLMLIVRLDISEEFERSDISFVLQKSRLHTATFQEIESDFNNGLLYRFDPLAVTLLYYQIETFPNTVLKWETAFNPDILAFRIWRKEVSENEYQVISGFIEAKEEFMQGAVYHYEDLTADSEKDYLYKLETILDNETSEFYEFTTQHYLFSDINNDHKLNLIDVIMILQYLSQN